MKICLHISKGKQHGFSFTQEYRWGECTIKRKNWWRSGTRDNKLKEDKGGDNRVIVVFNSFRFEL